jgi:hypothetical protein
MNSYALSPMMLPATFGNIFGTPVVEEFSVPPSHFYVLNILKFLSLLRQVLFLERATSHSEPNKEHWVGVTFH